MSRTTVSILRQTRTSVARVFTLYSAYILTFFVVVLEYSTDDGHTRIVETEIPRSHRVLPTGNAELIYGLTVYRRNAVPGLSNSVDGYRAAHVYATGNTLFGHVPRVRRTQTESAPALRMRLLCVGELESYTDTTAGCAKRNAFKRRNGVTEKTRRNTGQNGTAFPRKPEFPLRKKCIRGNRVPCRLGVYNN